ncbi:hypothetical protein J6590_083731 [Homalodisca vitripennis]|nr:hypothetical protein J6590_083731 [Homalodisca vitripennis]
MCRVSNTRETYPERSNHNRNLLRDSRGRESDCSIGTKLLPSRGSWFTVDLHNVQSIVMLEKRIQRDQITIGTYCGIPGGGNPTAQSALSCYRPEGVGSLYTFIRVEIILEKLSREIKSQSELTTVFPGEEIRLLNLH